MSIAERLKRLRQDNNMTQAELGQKLSVHQKQISAYERGQHVPSTEILIKIAEEFNVTLDYLAFEIKGGSSTISIQDRELLRRFEAIDKLSDKEKKLVIEILDLVILKNKFQKLAGSCDI